MKPYKPSHRPTSTDQVRPAASAHPIPIISEVEMFRFNMLEDSYNLPTRGPICDYESDHHTCIRRGEMKNVRCKLLNNDEPRTVIKTGGTPSLNRVVIETEVTPVRSKSIF